MSNWKRRWRPRWAVVLAGIIGMAMPAAVPVHAASPRVATSDCGSLDLRYPDGAPLTLTGAWETADGGVYELRQIGTCLWWAGFSDGPGVTGGDGFRALRPGLGYTNVFQGTITPGMHISGSWVDVPRGGNRGSGTLDLDIHTGHVPGLDFAFLQRTAETGGFGPTLLDQGSFPGAPGLPCQFGLGSSMDCTYRHVIRNDNHPMGSVSADGGGGGHERIYKDNVEMWGSVQRIRAGDFLGVGLPTYPQFMCPHENGLGGPLGDPPDADAAFDFQLDREQLDFQPGFWDRGWLNPAAEIQAKLDFNFPGPTRIAGQMAAYGRQSGRNDCAGQTQPLQPGWMEQGPNSVLFNGQPINDLVRQQGNVGSLLGGILPLGTTVRVTGGLGLACANQPFLRHPCAEGANSAQNVEIHPVYSIDVQQDFTQPRSNPTLTGSWEGGDVGTYYVRQMGSDVWWLGMSQDQGRSFTNVFHGTIARGRLSGAWADLPLGATQNNGDLGIRLSSPAAASTFMTRTSVTGGFGGDHWFKLYDR